MYKSRDGNDFRQAGFISLSRAGLLYSTSYNEGITTIILPSIGWDNPRMGIAFYGTRGPYWLRWGVGFRDQDKPRTFFDQLDRNIPGVVADQVVEVQPATQADLDFIAGLGDRDLARAMFGADFFERQTGNAIAYYADPEVRAVKIISRLLAVTEARDPGSGTAIHGLHMDLRKAADMLVALATQLPESSYAPYAAYCAGCCYVIGASNKLEGEMRKQTAAGRPRDKVAEAEQVASFFRSDPDCAKARNAFALAAQRADDYLNPRVLYQQATLSVVAGGFDGAETLLTRALDAAPGDPTIQKWVAKAREDARRIRAQLQKAKERPQDLDAAGQ